MKEIAGSEFELDCDLCLLAMGFLGPEQDGPIEQLGLKLDPRGNVVGRRKLHDQRPRRLRRRRHAPRAVLVVWAISEGRCAAHGVDEFLMGRSDLPKLKLF